MLVLLYYLSQNPDFTQSVKPLMGQLKNSQQMLNFLNDLSKFNETFSSLKQQPPQKAGGEETQSKADGKHKEGEPQNRERTDGEEKEKSSQSPTAGIADDFIQKILEGYLKNNGN